MRLMHVGHLSTRMASQAAQAVQAQDPMCAAPVCSKFPFFLQYNSGCYYYFYDFYDVSSSMNQKFVAPNLTLTLTRTRTLTLT